MNKNATKAPVSNYTLLKDCFLGAKDSVVSLNQRQAASLIAGGYICLQVEKKEVLNAKNKA